MIFGDQIWKVKKIGGILILKSKYRVCYYFANTEKAVEIVILYTYVRHMCVCVYS